MANVFNDVAYRIRPAAPFCTLQKRNLAFSADKFSVNLPLTVIIPVG
jgi:hypothetical protein